MQKTTAHFKVDKKEAEAFAKIWNQKGVSILLTDSSIQFAADFANVVLRNFIEMCQNQVVAKQKPATPKQIIVEGID